MLTCCCYVWTNGIYWENDDVEVIVEVTEHYRCVTIITSMEDTRKSHKVFNNVIKTVLKLSEIHSFKCEEYLIAPSDVAKARSLLISERTLYNIKNIARSVLTKCNVSDDKYTKKVDIKQIVGDHDPFLCIAPLVTKALFDDELPLQDDHLRHIMEKCSYFSSSLVSFNCMLIKE